MNLMVFTLLSVRWLVFRNSILRSGPQERRKTLANLFFSLLIIYVIGKMAYGFFYPFAEMARTDAGMMNVLRLIPSAAFFAAFWMLLLSAVTVGIQRFYLNQELTLLLATPINPRALFGAKFIEATLANAGLFLTIGAPVMLAYSFARGNITPPYIIYVLLTLTAFAALPTGLGILGSFVLMRVLPATRTREILGALGILAFACIYFALSISITRTHDPAVLRQGTANLAARLSAPMFHIGPWATAGSILSGDLPARECWIGIGWLSAIAAVVVLLTAVIAQHIHWRGWSNAQEAAVEDSSAAPVGEGWEQRLSMIPGPMRAVFLKDFRSLRRDMRQLSLLFIPIAVVAVFLVQFSHAHIRNAPAALLVLGLYPILAMISLRLAMSGFVTENRAMWLMIAAPNDPRTVLAGKFLYAYSLSMPLAGITTMLYGVMRGLTGMEIFVAVALAVCAVAAFCGIGVGASAVFSDFGVENSKFTVSVGGRLTTFAFQMGYLTLLILVTVVPWAMVSMGAASPGPAYLLATLAVVLVTSAFVVLPLILGAIRLRRLEW